MEFENVEDRNYYVQKDPAHLAFVEGLNGIIEKAQVVDFTNGVFWWQSILDTFFLVIWSSGYFVYVLHKWRSWSI